MEEKKKKSQHDQISKGGSVFLYRKELQLILVDLKENF